MDIMDRDGEKKQKDFIGVTPVMPCQNSSWIMGLRIYGEGRTQIPLSSPATIGPLARIRDRQGLYWLKRANNTKINHIMVSFTDHYNGISIDRLPSKAKIGKDSWKRFTKKKNILCKPEFSSVTQTSFSIKNTKNNHSSASDW